MKTSKYVALLRGINVGGKNIIKMTDLKEEVEKSGYKKVSTFIQSGNVIFETDEDSTQNITKHLEIALSKAFSYQSKIVLIFHDQLKQILSEIPIEWKHQDNLRCYIAFVKEPMTPQKVLAEVKLKEDVDSAKLGKGVVYMSTLLTGITKSGFTKLIGSKVYQDITIRNYTTSKKILEHMGE
jgi:uncharacterized protein (DUF1697 family)